MSDEEDDNKFPTTDAGLPDSDAAEQLLFRSIIAACEELGGEAEANKLADAKPKAFAKLVAHQWEHAMGLVDNEEPFVQAFKVFPYNATHVRRVLEVWLVADEEGRAAWKGYAWGRLPHPDE